MKLIFLDVDGVLNSDIFRQNYEKSDDDSDMLYWQRYNFFQTDAYVGITPNLAYKIKNFLNN